ncbi:MAG: hypothetical protein JRI63_14005, partial [Deltaproteobacteria bacterium]|nr:hypothetical protein [Deltaproteobacteria bacterium]
MCRTRDVGCEAGVFWEEAGRSTERTPRGRGPGTYARIAEIMSGRAIFQQGPAATCKDLLSKLRLKEAGGIWSGACLRADA